MMGEVGGPPSRDLKIYPSSEFRVHYSHRFTLRLSQWPCCAVCTGVEAFFKFAARMLLQDLDGFP